MTTDNATLPVEHRSENDRLKRAFRHWWRSWFAPEMTIFRGSWQWFAWSVTIVGLLGAPLLLASGRTALAVGVGMVGASFALEGVGVQIAATHRRLARALHIASVVVLFGLLALFLWRNPFERWHIFAIIFGGSILRSFWEAWRETAPDRIARTTA